MHTLAGGTLSALSGTDCLQKEWILSTLKAEELFDTQRTIGSSPYA